MNIGDGSFELKPALINMVQQSPLCGKASEDANAHLQHFLEICSTFTIRGVTQDACQPGRSAPIHFLPSFFLLGKTNALRNKISRFQQLIDETIVEAWECLQDYISRCPHHGMEEWFIIQSFYHGLIHSAQEHIDAAAGCSFFALSIEKAHKLVEKMTSNQRWVEERTQTHTCMVCQLE
jgi:hypothetical protein